jgi:hypothetical protein
MLNVDQIHNYYQNVFLTDVKNEAKRATSEAFHALKKISSLETHHKKLASRNQELEDKVRYFRKKVYATSNGKNNREQNDA